MTICEIHLTISCLFCRKIISVWSDDDTLEEDEERAKCCWSPWHYWIMIYLVWYGIGFLNYRQIFMLPCPSWDGFCLAHHSTYTCESYMHNFPVGTDMMHTQGIFMAHMHHLCNGCTLASSTHLHNLWSGKEVRESSVWIAICNSPLRSGSAASLLISS